MLSPEVGCPKMKNLNPLTCQAHLENFYIDCFFSETTVFSRKLYGFSDNLVSFLNHKVPSSHRRRQLNLFSYVRKSKKILFWPCDRSWLNWCFRLIKKLQSFWKHGFFCLNLFSQYKYFVSFSTSHTAKTAMQDSLSWIGSHCSLLLIGREGEAQRFLLVFFLTYEGQFPRNHWHVFSNY